MAINPNVVSVGRGLERMEIRANHALENGVPDPIEVSGGSVASEREKRGWPDQIKTIPVTYDTGSDTTKQSGKLK